MSILLVRFYYASSRALDGPEGNMYYICERTCMFGSQHSRPARRRVLPRFRNDWFFFRNFHPSVDVFRKWRKKCGSVRLNAERCNSVVGVSAAAVLVQRCRSSAVAFAVWCICRTERQKAIGRFATVEVTVRLVWTHVHSHAVLHALTVTP